MNIQQELKDLRTAKGLSREKLAQLCGTTSQTIYRAEKTGRITLNNYLKIIETLKNVKTITNSSL
jgi:transcriptional regulator with XRE-family HTH domain